MAFMLALGGVASLLGPKLIGAVASAFATKLGKRIWGSLRGGEEGQLKRDLEHALTAGNVEPILIKYAAKLTPEEVTQLRSLARLRGLFRNLEETVNEQIYTEDRAQDFIETTKILEDTALDIDFDGAGVRSIKVKDTETGEQLPITTDTYLVALLLRFAAAVWSQVARKTTPEKDGWALEYGQEVKVVLEKVKMKRSIPAGAPMMELEMADAGPSLLDPEFHAFREAFERLLPAYRQGLAIRDRYLKVVACLHAAQRRVEQLTSNVPIHSTMTTSYINAIAQGIRGEAQYWLFHSSPHLHQDALTLQEIISKNRNRAEEYLQRLNATQMEANLLLDSLKLYSQFSDGLAGTHSLYQQAATHIKQGNDAQHLQQRLKTLVPRISTNPQIWVDDPAPII
jgi:hypothetical protein